MPISLHTSEWPEMLWRTRCVGCGPTCGGRRRRSEPERAGGERGRCKGCSLDGRACWKGGGRGSRRCGRCLGRRLPRHWSCARGLLCVVAVPPTSPAHGRTVRQPTLGNGGNESPETSPQTKTQEQAVETRYRRCRCLCVQACSGASSPESALGVGPRLLQNEPGDLDTQDSGGENEPTFMGRANPGPFSRRRSRSFSDRDLPGCIRQATRKIWRINSLGENSSVERNHSARAGTDPDYRKSLPAQASPTGASQRSVASRSTRLRRRAYCPAKFEVVENQPRQ